MLLPGKLSDLVAFVLRCTAAAAIAFFLASAVRLAHPLWACIFAIIASQGGAAAALGTIGGRVIGTIVGALVTVAVDAAVGWLGLDVPWGMFAAVAVGAMFAWRWPAIQICMWTPPIILVSAAPGETVAILAAARACEVILGVVIGGLVARAADWVRRAPSSAD
jgi:uncharacterized membrane protein YgaE (UPF0421/DUF939 family)